MFKTSGLLANSWPGFIDVYGLPVTVRTIRVDEKVYITEVHLDRMRDVLFEAALTAQQADSELRERILDLIQAWMGEVNGEASDEASGEVEPVDEELEPEVMIEQEGSGEVAYQAFEQVEPTQVEPEQMVSEQVIPEQVALAPEPSVEQPMGEQVVFEQPTQYTQSPELSSQAASPDQPVEEITQPN